MPVYSDRLWFKYPIDRYDVDRQYSSLNYWQSGISIERTSTYTPHIIKIAERATIASDRIAYHTSLDVERDSPLQRREPEIQQISPH
jgi:hypothetical protein